MQIKIRAKAGLQGSCKTTEWCFSQKFTSKPELVLIYMMVSRLAEKENYDGMFFFFLHVVVYMIMVGRLTKKKEVKLGRAGSLLASGSRRAPAELQTL